ncbi:2'-5' RNA ligase family protein [Cellulosilyticum ruminicola]|uniref:2'-5' RNA ligase family protein n=1 Tax=Cellulosilyticum ruminicola TaxID=425254 RepID=UPI0006CFA109|nr:2'-5' RNA ligase family protein [Cellulosilyticum ruminicola]
MKRRSIVLIPQFRGLEMVENIREKYDPLAHAINAHITLVAPFNSTFSTRELENWIKKLLSRIEPFELELKGISMASNAFENYLFLNIIRGREEIFELNNILYDGLLREFKSSLPYIPHMTLGKLPNKETLDGAYEDVKRLQNNFVARIETVYVIEHNEDDTTFVEIAYNL